MPIQLLAHGNAHRWSEYESQNRYHRKPLDASLLPYRQGGLPSPGLVDSADNLSLNIPPLVRR